MNVVGTTRRGLSVKSGRLCKDGGRGPLSLMQV